MTDKITGSIEKIKTSPKNAKWRGFVVNGQMYSTLKDYDNFNVGDNVVIEWEQSGQFTNLLHMYAVHGDVKVEGVDQVHLVEEKPKVSRSTTMYTSYAKDIFLILGNDEEDSKDTMDRAIALVKQAKEAFE
jgi:hypothetical protein|tara:strand:- start:684 stop:1076 length:393 start_codon:yes stop_codon:yes gene_type:complete